MERAVFLDRDGVIIEDVGYLNECGRIKFLPRASEAIKLLNENGFKVIVVTNQSGVARGYFTEETVKEINRNICESLAKQGAFIDKIYYCPHHVEGTVSEYVKDCHCRKPSPGMIEEATREFGIDVENSFVVGDKFCDIEAGRRVGCKTILLASGSSLSKEEETTLMSTHVASDLYEAVKWLLKISSEGDTRRLSPEANLNRNCSLGLDHD
jgi:histidinol-phosphate phosphatase family protein